MATTLKTRLKRHLRVSGIVQGVGFRPYVWRLARGLGLTGWVRNDPAGVEVLVEGEPGPIDAFTSRLPLEAPPLAQVRDLVWSDDPGSGEHEGFAIRESGAGQAATMIGVDAAVCPACLAELFDPADRRYRYAFINCTHCGPRYTLTHRLPYDRARTSMAAFPLCAACEGEYRDPSDRRFHAEPTACPVCGPRLRVAGLEEIPSAAVPRAASGQGWPVSQATPGTEEVEPRRERRPRCRERTLGLPPPSLESPVPPLEKGGGRDACLETSNGTGGFVTPPFPKGGTGGIATPTADAIGESLGRLQAGQIVAIKGLGGFHLACDARNPDAVQRLRERKQREEKPFAIMAANLASVAPWVEIGPDERALIESPERPICLLRKRPGADAALPGIAPGLSWLGVMLPYTPIHWLLFHAAAGGPDGTDWMAEVQGLVLVMTSANPGGEPLVTGNAEALERLAGIADAVLMHDRDIVVRCDDSVVRWLEEVPSAAVPDAALPPRSLESPGLPLRKGGDGLAVGMAPSGSLVAPEGLGVHQNCQGGTVIPPFRKGGRGGIQTQTAGLTLADYAPRLKTYARELRTHQTEAEQRLWQRLRRDQLGVRFLRQRPLGEYILDFYAAALHLAVEVDGSQHLAPGGRARDQGRDAWLRSQGIRVLRFDDRQVLLETDGVVEVILRAVQQACGRIPPNPPLGKGGGDSPGGSGAICTSSSAKADQADSDIPPFSKEGSGDLSLRAAVPTSIPPNPPLGKGGEDSPEGSAASCTPSSEKADQADSDTPPFAKADQADSDTPPFAKGGPGDWLLQAAVPTALPPSPPLGKGGEDSPEGSGAICTSSSEKADQADSDTPPVSKGGRGDFSLRVAVPTSIPPDPPLGKGGEGSISPIPPLEKGGAEMVRQGFKQFIRRGRGYTPQAIRLPGSGPSVLALGGYLKTTVCVTRGDEAFVSQHIGGLDNPATCAMLMEVTDHLLDILRVEPQAVAHDLHPDFFSTRHGVELAGRWDVPTVAVQHHQAHCAAVAAESGATGPYLGLALDGVGLGDDGTAWGGELLRLDGVSYRRLGHLSPIPLPGGDRAAKEPWRMAAAALHRLGRGGEIAGRFPGQPAAGRLGQVLDLGLNCPPTTSLGRWFDAAAGLLGAREVMAYEGQAAMLLEGLAGAVQAAPVAGGWVLHPDGCLDLWPLLARLMDEPDAALGAALFHATLAEGLAAWAAWAAGREGLSRVVLSGGCLLNQILSRDLTRRLGALGLTALTACQVPPNDGGLSLGQAWVAMQQFRHEELKPCA